MTWATHLGHLGTWVCCCDCCVGCFAAACIVALVVGMRHAAYIQDTDCSRHACTCCRTRQTYLPHLPTLIGLAPNRGGPGGGWASLAGPVGPAKAVPNMGEHEKEDFCDLESWWSGPPAPGPLGGDKSVAAAAAPVGRGGRSRSPRMRSSPSPGSASACLRMTQKHSEFLRITCLEVGLGSVDSLIFVVSLCLSSEKKHHDIMF